MPKSSGKTSDGERKFFFLSFLLCVIFFSAYSVLSVIRHNHYQSGGYDLGINDQTVWRYSIFQLPLTTIDPHPDKTKLYEHVELVYALISPAYWIWSSRRMLLILEVAFVCAGGIAIYLLAKSRNLKYEVRFAVLFAYLAFFGVQNAIWFDVHSISFAAGFLAWFLYYLDRKKIVPTVLFFILAITSKENVGLITFFIAFTYFIKRRDRFNLYLMTASVLYVGFIFLVYFPYIIRFPYPYQNSGGLLSNLNPLSLFDTREKLNTLFLTGAGFGFLPLLTPLSLIPAFADIGTYFVLASDLPGAQGIYAHYRITLAPLLAWATIIVASTHKVFNNRYFAVYLLFSTLAVQYFLHLPLSYLSKGWFWMEPSGVKNIESMIQNYLPDKASVAAQNNIVPHISHRDKIYSLYPVKKHFDSNSPCGRPDCDWFTWYDHPEFLFVDTSPEWDARHLLENNEDFVKGIKNLEKGEVVEVYKRIENATLYKIKSN